MPYGNAELFVSLFEGGPERKLMDGVATIVSWSADSTRILYATKGLATWNTINVNTGEITRLLDNSGNHIHSPELSPDGNWLLVKALEGAENRCRRLYRTHPKRGGRSDQRLDQSGGKQVGQRGLVVAGWQSRVLPCQP